MLRIANDHLRKQGKKPIQICQMFDAGSFAEEKCEWLKLFPGRFDLSQPGQLNLWGNEEDLFVSDINYSVRINNNKTGTQT